MSAGLARADFLIEQNRDRDASVVLRNALLAFPDRGLMMLRLGEILDQFAAVRDDGIELFKRVVSINSRTVAACRALAWTLARYGRNAQAVETLRAWCVAALDDPGAHTCLPRFRMKWCPCGPPKDLCSKRLIRWPDTSALIAFDAHHLRLGSAGVGHSANCPERGRSETELEQSTDRNSF